MYYDDDVVEQYMLCTVNAGINLNRPFQQDLWTKYVFLFHKICI